MLACSADDGPTGVAAVSGGPRRRPCVARPEVLAEVHRYLRDSQAEGRKPTGTSRPPGRITRRLTRLLRDRRRAAGGDSEPQRPSGGGPVLGAAPEGVSTYDGTPLLLLHHIGARSGASRVNPLAYLPAAGRHRIWAANGGAPKHPAWYQNLKTHPFTRIEVGSETIDVVAEEATGDKRVRLFARSAQRYPSLAEIAQRTERVIPLVVLTPLPSP